MKKVCKECIHFRTAEDSRRCICIKFPESTPVEANKISCGEFSTGFKEKFNYAVGIMVLFGWSFYVLTKCFDYGWF